ncbi:hypothetical protein KC362_g91 [Hortaea werneckii]|nr:hypothetical protein KC362_g91 [Hortaea werneckii]
MSFDFSKIDYELARARCIGQGLWSKVWLADAKHPERRRPALPTPPSSPPKWTSSTTASSLFAVKTAARPDAADVFKQETKVLTHLMRIYDASQYVVTFHGLDLRNSALVFEAVIGGSFEGLKNRLKQMTEVSRHLELVNLFPGLASDLVSGLEFLHDAGVVHADIKPANILLDISDHISLPKPVVRARYIDFSAAFRLDSDDSTENSGGTWDYMAPEQLRLQKDLNTPTFASDVWSLGINLLSLLVGDSPYTAACSGNLFMLQANVGCTRFRDRQHLHGKLGLETMTSVASKPWSLQPERSDVPMKREEPLSPISDLGEHPPKADRKWCDSDGSIARQNIGVSSSIAPHPRAQTGFYSVRFNAANIWPADGEAEAEADLGGERGEAAQDHRPNPNIGKCSASFGCYPCGFCRSFIISQLASYVDLNTLHELSQTCRQIRANILQYRRLLIEQALRCTNEDIGEVAHLGDVPQSGHDSYTTYGRDGQIWLGNVANAALQSVETASSSHHHLMPLSFGILFQNAMGLKTLDLSALRTDIAECRYDLHAGMGMACTLQRLRWSRRWTRRSQRGLFHEHDCDEDELENEMANAEIDSRHMHGSSYTTQEIVGIGGRVKRKVKKRVHVGAIVKEYEDERLNGKFLSREQSGANRSWCSWCCRVVPGKKDADNSTSSTDNGNTPTAEFRV